VSGGSGIEDDIPKEINEKEDKIENKVSSVHDKAY